MLSIFINIYANFLQNRIKMYDYVADRIMHYLFGSPIDCFAMNSCDVIRCVINLSVFVCLFFFQAF